MSEHIRERRISASVADWEMVMAQLESPPAPNEKLAKLLADYHEKVNAGILTTSACQVALAR